MARLHTPHSSDVESTGLIARLPVTVRWVTSLVLLDGMTIEEIAALARVKPKVVSNVLQQGLDLLAQTHVNGTPN